MRSEISFLSRFFARKYCISSSRLLNSFFFAKIPQSLSTSSAVAPSANQNTGTPIKSASTVHIPKLSFVRLTNPAASLMISAIHSGFRPVKITVLPASCLSSSSSGPEPITIKGSCKRLKSWIISPVSLTKLTNLPT